MAMGNSGDNDGADQTETARATVPTVNWNDSGMKTSYANVVNAASSREEVTLFFGTNQTWNMGGKNEFDVLLSDRIILNPLAAKRLWVLLGSVLKEYESRYGALSVNSTGSSKTTTPAAGQG